MSDEELNRKIAEFCGWENDSFPGYAINHKTGMIKPWRELPNYAGDLNAMHEAENAIPNILWTDYAMAIRKVIQRDCNTEEHYAVDCGRSQWIADFWFYHATARQRAEALGSLVPDRPHQRQHPSNEGPAKE